MERLEAMPENSDRELPVLEKLFIKDPNPRNCGGHGAGYDGGRN